MSPAAALLLALLILPAQTTAGDLRWQQSVEPSGSSAPAAALSSSGAGTAQPATTSPENRASAAEPSTPPEMIDAALTLPSDHGLRGQPVSLAAALAGTSDASRQIQIVRAYWRLAESVAAYHFQLQHRSTLQALDRTEDVDWRAVTAAAEADIGRAQLQVVQTQHELADAAEFSASMPLPLPQDRPHVGEYQTQFAQMFASRLPPWTARRLDRTLPLRFRAIDRQAAVVRAAEEALEVARRSFEQSPERLPLRDVVATAERLRQSRNDWMAAACRYNDQIAEYAVSVIQPGTTGEALVRLLIEPQGGSIAPQPGAGRTAVEPAGHIATPPVLASPDMIPGLHPAGPRWATPRVRPPLMQPQPTPAVRPAPMPPSLVPTPAVRPDATPGQLTPTPAVRPSAINQPTPAVRPAIGDEQPDTPSETDVTTDVEQPAESTLEDSQWRAPGFRASSEPPALSWPKSSWPEPSQSEPVPIEAAPVEDAPSIEEPSPSRASSSSLDVGKDLLKGGIDVADDAQPASFTEDPSPRSSSATEPRLLPLRPVVPIEHREAIEEDAAEGPEDWEPFETATESEETGAVSLHQAQKPEATTGSRMAPLYPALAELAPPAQAKGLTQALHWDRQLPEDVGEPIGLADCLRACRDGDRLGLLQAFWKVRQRAAAYHLRLQQKQWLDELEASSFLANAAPTADDVPHTRWQMARAEADAAIDTANAALIEAQFDLARRIGREGDAVWPMAATAPHWGRYALQLDALPVGLAGTSPVRQLAAELPQWQEQIERRAVAIIAADQARAALPLDEASTAPLLDACRRQTEQSLALVAELTEYNQAIGRYVLSVLPARATPEELAASLVVEQYNYSVHEIVNTARGLRTRARGR